MNIHTYIYRSTHSHKVDINTFTHYVQSDLTYLHALIWMKVCIKGGS